MKLSKLAFTAALSLLLWGRSSLAQESYEPVAEETAPPVKYVLSDSTGSDVDHLASYARLGDCDNACNSGCDNDCCGPNCFPLADLEIGRAHV